MKLIKYLLKKIFLNLRLDYILRRINKTPRILFWHGIDFIKNSQVEAESFHVNEFKKQIDFLVRNYEIISIEEFYQRFMCNSFTNKEVVLTFDDGYLNNLTIVAPYLTKKNIPFTVFISTEHVEKNILFPTSVERIVVLGSDIKEISVPSLGINKLNITSNGMRNEIHEKIRYALKTQPLHMVNKIIAELKCNLTENNYNELVDLYSSVKPMNWEQVTRLKDLGATIGSHCKDHICCHANQDIDELKIQVCESKIILEDKLKFKCDFFAYPNGDYTEISNEIVRESGYKMGFSVEKKRISKSLNNISAIPRLGVPSDLDSLKLIMAFYPH